MSIKNVICAISVAPEFDKSNIVKIIIRTDSPKKIAHNGMCKFVPSGKSDTKKVVIEEICDNLTVMRL